MLIPNISSDLQNSQTKSGAAGHTNELSDVKTGQMLRKDLVQLRMQSAHSSIFDTRGKHYALSHENERNEDIIKERLIACICLNNLHFSDN